MTKFLSIVIILVITGLLFFNLIVNGIIRFNNPDKDEFPVWGIDISHHQGVINWEKLRDEKISFIIIKATEGGDYKDPLFTMNRIKSRAEGYKTGAYHFYRFCKDGKEQAKNFLEAVPKDSNDLPPTVDLEFGGNCKTEKGKEQILSELKEFLNILEIHYQKRPIIYATQDFYREFLEDNLANYPIWIRDVFGKPKLKNGRNWTIWQFANRGRLNGIDTFVDLNVINGKSLEAIQ